MGRKGWTKMIVIIVGVTIGTVIGYLVGHATVRAVLGVVGATCIVAE